MDNQFYSIIDYSVDSAETQAAVISAFADIQRKWVASYPGYGSAKFLASPDGTRVLCIVGWASEADFARFEAISDSEGRAAAIQNALQKLSCSAERRSFRLAETVKATSGEAPAPGG